MAPRLYATGLGLTIAGIAGVVALVLGARVGFVHGWGTAAYVLLEGFLLATLFGLAAGSIAQTRQRVADGWQDYAGPSPLLLTGAWLAATTALELGIGAAFAVLKMDVSASAELLLAVVVNLACFVALVQWLVIRPGALSWRDVARPLHIATDPSDYTFSWTSYRWVARHEEQRQGRIVGDVLMGIALAIPLLIATDILALILEYVLGLQNVDTSGPLPTTSVTSQDMWLLLIASAVVAPLGEEIFFRGFATNAWGRSLTRSATLFRAAVLFASVHVIDVIGTAPDDWILLRLAILAVLVRIPVAWALGWIYVRRRSIYASIALHSTYNGCIVLLLWWVLNQRYYYGY